MLDHIEIVENPNAKGEWIVEGQTEDGGIRRAVFIDADAKSRAENYADFMKFLHQQNRRMSAA